MKGTNRTQQLDHLLAMPMYVISMVALALVAALLHLYHLPIVGGSILWVCKVGLAILYPIVWGETLVHYLAGSQFMKQHVWFCLFPFTRIGARDHETGQEVWLPRLKWREANRPFERMLARKFSIPMIVIALMVLPVVVLEFFYKEFVSERPGWAAAQSIAESFIWAAFTYEFIVMMSVVKYPFGYVKKHWIDLAIILLPMLAFVRTLRLTSLMRLNQLSRTARVYRLRGLGMRMWRGILALEIIEKLLSRNPERRLEKLREQLIDKEEEIDYLKKDITRLRERVIKKRAAERARRKELGLSEDMYDEDADLDDHEKDDALIEQDKPSKQDSDTPRGENDDNDDSDDDGDGDEVRISA